VWQHLVHGGGHFRGCVGGSVCLSVLPAVSVVASLVVVSVVSPAVVVALVPLALLLWQIQRRFVATNRELKRLDSVAFSPLLSDFAETVAGLVRRPLGVGSF
jgi:hypothetical protein